MEYIRKIPLLLGTGTGLFIGLLGFSTGVPNKENMLNMCVGMVIFYTVGILVRSTVKNITDHIADIAQKKEEEEKKKREQDKQDKIEELNKEEASQDANPDGGKAEPAGDESFEDLPIAEFIKSELK